MTTTHETWWILGFDAEDVRAWHDASLAEAIDTVWEHSNKTAALQAWWMACSDAYAFRWYVSPALGRALDDAGVDWRGFVIGRGWSLAPAARTYLPIDAMVRAAS